MKNNIDPLWLIPVAIVCITIGYFSTQYQYFDFDYTINLLDLLSLLATIFIGVSIAKKIQNSIESSRVEKTLIIDAILELKQKLKLIAEKVDNRFFSFADMLKDLRDFSILLAELEQYQQICHGDNIGQEFQTKYIEIKRIITSTSPVYNQITLTSTQRSNAKIKIKELSLLLVEKLVSTNRK